MHGEEEEKEGTGMRDADHNNGLLSRNQGSEVKGVTFCRSAEDLND